MSLTFRTFRHLLREATAEAMTPNRPQARPIHEASGRVRQEILGCLQYLRDHAKTNTIERGILIDLRTGERLFDSLGDQDRVSLPVPLLRDATQSMTVIHNHPPSGPHPMQYAAGPFSKADWNVFAQAGVQDMYVVSTDGTWRLHKTKDWTPTSGPMLADTLHYAFGRIIDSVMAREHFTDESQITAAMGTAIAHEGNRALARITPGLTYTKVA